MKATTRDPNEYRIKYDVQDLDCHYCTMHIAVGSNDDFDALRVAEMICWLAGYINDLDDLGEGIFATSVCQACAERRVGPDWLEKGRAAIADFNAFDSKVKASGCSWCSDKRH